MRGIATKQSEPGGICRPVNATRRAGYVTNALIREHGSYATALLALNGAKP